MSIHGAPTTQGPADEALSARSRVSRATAIVSSALLGKTPIPPRARRQELETITDPSRIAAIVRRLFAARSEAWLQRPVDDSRIAATPVYLEPSLTLPLLWRIEGAAPPAPFSIEAFELNWGFRMSFALAQAHDGVVATSMPLAVERTSQRSFRRAPAPVGALVHVPHRALSSQVLRRPVDDVSLLGLSFTLRGPDDPITLGMQLPYVEVVVPSGERVRFRGVVRHLAALAGGRRRCGLSLEPLRERDWTQWLTLTDRQLYGNTIVGVGWHDEIWDLFVSSGYFNLSGKVPTDFEGQRRAFAQVNRRLPEATDVLTQVVCPVEGRAEASVTMGKMYSNTWVTFQVARQRSPAATRRDGSQILFDSILHAFEYPQRDPSFRWFVSWVQERGRWSRWLLHDLAARHLDDRTRVDVTRFRVMEADCVRAPAVHHDLDVGPARDDEIVWIASALATARSRPYVEAHDLTLETLGMEEITRQWAAAGMNRRRVVLAARRGEVTLAAAILELVDEGVHLFGLFDSARLVSLARDGRDAFLPLLAAARQWFREHGKERFVYLVEDGDLRPAHAFAMRDLGGADLLVLASDLLSQQVQHAWEITAPRDVPPLFAR